MSAAEIASVPKGGVSMVGDRVSRSATHSAPLVCTVTTNKGVSLGAARVGQLGSPVSVPAILSHDRQVARDRAFAEGARQRALELHKSRARKVAAEPVLDSEGEVELGATMKNKSQSGNKGLWGCLSSALQRFGRGKFCFMPKG